MVEKKIPFFYQYSQMIFLVLWLVKVFPSHTYLVTILVLIPKMVHTIYVFIQILYTHIFKTVVGINSNLISNHKLQPTIYNVTIFLMCFNLLSYRDFDIDFFFFVSWIIQYLNSFFSFLGFFLSRNSSKLSFG